VETVLPRLRFSFAVGPQFFSEIAKFRAFRLLWARVAQAFTPKATQVRPAVHARTARWNKTVLDLHVNMLRGTTEALSAVLGGIDSLHIGPFDEIVGVADEFSRRIARNVHTLLAEEFRLLSPTDPAGGSWYVEKLTDELARKAWGLFQEIEKQGGCAAALRNGFIQKQVAAIAAEKADAVGKRRLGMVGTNLFPNLREKLVTARTTADVTARKGEIAARRPKIERPSASAWSDLFVAAQNAAEKGATIGQLSTWTVTAAGETAAVALTPRRASEVFENLRRASEAIAAKGAGRPKVFVAKMGPLTQHKARADFTAGFFAVGGFEMIAKETFETAEAAAAAAAKSGAPVAVLCSTDETYPTLAPAFAQALKAAKPEVTLVLAGLPAPDVAATFKAAGFDEFIHIRANVAELLGKLLTKLGAKL
jgi:methylmalonyl-CoA mutase